MILIQVKWICNELTAKLHEILLIETCNFGLTVQKSALYNIQGETSRALSGRGVSSCFYKLDQGSLTMSYPDPLNSEGGLS